MLLLLNFVVLESFVVNSYFVAVVTHVAFIVQAFLSTQ